MFGSVNSSRLICLSGLFFCLLVGGYLRLAGYDWGYNRVPELPRESQPGYMHPDERSVYSKTDGLRWESLSRNEGEQLWIYGIKNYKHNFLRQESGMNLKSFNYGSLPYYVLFFLSSLANQIETRPALITLWGVLILTSSFVWLYRWWQRKKASSGGILYPLALTAGIIVLGILLSSVINWIFRKPGNIVWDYGSWALLGRPLSALAGTLTIFYIYRIGARLYNRRIGLLAAILLAFTVLHIQLSHYFTFDVIQAFLTTAAIYSLLVFLDSGLSVRGWRAILCSAIWGGLALATKFGSIFYLLPLLAALVLQFWRHRPQVSLTHYKTGLFLLHLILAGMVSFSVFWGSAFVGMPFGFLDFNPDTQKPSLAFMHINLNGKQEMVANPTFINRLKNNLISFLNVTGIQLDPYTSPFGFHFKPHRDMETNQVFDDLITVGSSLHWRHVREQRQMALKGGVPWTRQYTNTTPFFYQWHQLILYGMGIPLGILCLAGLFWGIGRPFLRPTWGEWLLLFWIIPNLYTTHFIHTKFPRYLAPLLPFLCLWGSVLAVQVCSYFRQKEKKDQIPYWRKVSTALSLAAYTQEAQRRLGSKNFHISISSILVVLVLVTVTWSLLYSLAFIRIYMEPHTWTVCSRWFANEVPDGKKIITETWDDSVPWDGQIAGRYQRRNTDPVRTDDPSNIQDICRQLAWSDYYCFSSKRNYGAFLQAPQDSPNRVRFYKSLFAGNLGYRLVKTFSRPVSVLGIPIHFELADESLSLYDHPTVHIFQKVQDLPPEELSERILNPPDWIDRITKEQVLTADETRFILAPHVSYATPLWLLSWLFLGWLFWPITARLFRASPDRGVFSSRFIALVLVTWLTWLGASLGVWANQPYAMTLVVFGIIPISLSLLRRDMQHHVQFVSNHWRLILISELQFVLVFAYFGFIRMSNSDIHWGEKPMDIALLNAVYSNDQFPAEDPWFQGKSINYYYYGHIMAGLLGKWIGLPSEYTYNLACATWPALLFTLVFGLVYNLSRSWGGALLAGFLSTFAGNGKSLIQLVCNLGLPGGPLDPKEGFREKYVPHDGLIGYLNSAGEQILATLSLSGHAIYKTFQAVHSQLTSNTVDNLQQILGFDSYFWKLSRICKSAVACEFPSWTATFADLHAHFLALPLGALFLSLVVAYCQTRSGLLQRSDTTIPYDRVKISTQTGIPHILLVGLLTGIVSCTNTWDLPGLFGIWFVSLALLFVTGHLAPPQGLAVNQSTRALVRMGIWGRSIRKFTHWKMTVAREILLPLCVTWIAGLVFMLPFHQSFKTPERVKGLGFMHQAACGWTTPYELIQIFGPFILLIGIGIVWYYWRWCNTNGKGGWIPGVWVILSGGIAWGVSLFLRLCALKNYDPSQVKVPPLLSQDLEFWRYLDSEIAYVTFGFCLFLVLLISPFWLGRRLELNQRLGLLVLSAGLGVITGCEMIYVIEGWGPPLHRWNTVFKFHLQAWVCLSIGCGYLFSQWWNLRAPLMGVTARVISRMTRYGLGYPLIFIALLWAAVFPLCAPFIFSEANGFEFRTRQIPGKVTWDGLNYLRQKEIDTANTIDWIRYHLKKKVVVLEAAGESYINNRSRISTFTGFPTLIGWPHHSRERGNIPEPRIETVRQIYTSRDRKQVRDLLQKNRVQYVLVSPVERNLYALGEGRGLSKFDEWTDLFYKAFESKMTASNVTLYGVHPKYFLSDQAPLVGETKPTGFFVKDSGIPLLQGGEGYLPGQFKEPRAIVFSAIGQAYIADTFNHRIQSFDKNGTFLWWLGDKGSEPGTLNEPNDVDCDAQGNLHVLDTWNSRVQIFSSTGSLKTIIPISSFGPRGIAVGNLPYAVEQEGKWVIPKRSNQTEMRIIIADTGRKRIQMFDMKGEPISGWGDNLVFGEPVDVCLSPWGLLVTDPKNCLLHLLDAGGRKLAAWMLPTEPTGSITNEMHVTWNPHKPEIAISDPEHDQVIILDSNGQVINKIPVNGRPTGIAFSPGGDLYVTLRGQHRIVVIPTTP